MRHPFLRHCLPISGEEQISLPLHPKMTDRHVADAAGAAPDIVATLRIPAARFGGKGL
jgi:hypothetical protein